ncbi:protein DBF4 homolog A-like [Pseudophryne corroboree]|uniref:protein DBF4 homolog A-like n=2 Tax=Pseudophryne corroboree TaxID=495146 RepID=UPI0030815ED3
MASPVFKVSLKLGEQSGEVGMKKMRVIFGYSYSQQVRAQEVKAQEVPALEVKEPEPKPIPVMKLMDPFIKVEDVSRHYRPLFGLRLIFECPYGPSHPMDTKESEHKTAAHQGPTKMPGYCECCRCIYPDLEEHLESPQHKNVVEGQDYKALDDLIATLCADWEEH